MHRAICMSFLLRVEGMCGVALLGLVLAQFKVQRVILVQLVLRAMSDPLALRAMLELLVLKVMRV